MSRDEVHGFYNTPRPVLNGDFSRQVSDGIEAFVGRNSVSDEERQFSADLAKTLYNMDAVEAAANAEENFRAFVESARLISRRSPLLSEQANDHP